MAPLAFVKQTVELVRGARLGRAFTLLFIAGVLADLGGFATQTALTIHVYRLTGHDSTYLGLMALATLLPMIVAAPIGGVWAERGNRTRILTVAILLRVPIVLLMMAAAKSVAGLLVLQGALCASVAIAMPARQSLIPELVPESSVQLANTLLGGVLSVVHVLGPTLGAYVYETAGGLPGVVAVEAALYLAAATCIGLGLREPVRGKPGSQEGLAAQVVDGLRYVLGSPDLRQIFAILLAAGIAIGLLIPLMRPFTQETLHGDDTAYARLMAAFGLGGMAGPLVGLVLGRWLGLGRALSLCFALDALLLLLFARAETPWLSRAALFLWGVEVFALIPCYMSYVHAYARKDYMARTFSLFDQSVYLPQIVSAALVALIGNRVPAQAMLTAAGAIYLLVLAMTSMTAGAKLLRARAGKRAMGVRSLFGLDEGAGVAAGGEGGAPGAPGADGEARS